ncbi:uncharacterized protein N7515_008217 [Penicillium bovifimosum]|uniref:Major facilitator superfamily (MFS) profile domain-containing protein n=1 Tax=Penicillium bovifimosum TaxID=126998 RepID=A0A9W9KXA4_9EURO|nr:uncharacterized protein N7515_008217 [Penicillium bovifimosum]KAJ5124392.1 hypothetical protein N7515_008217 [Penicillium bovifimosum]
MQEGQLHLEIGSQSLDVNNDLPGPYQIPEDHPLLGPGSIEAEPTPVEFRRGLAIILCTISVLFMNCALNNLVTLNIPLLSLEFELSPGVELWPMTMYYLAQGCTFLLAGSLADVLGSRKIFLAGCFLQIVCHLGSGLAQTGAQLLVLRTLSGVAYPMCFISAMSIHRNHIPTGNLSKLASSCTSGSHYIGSLIGITLSGVLSETIGWRWGFLGAALMSLFAFFLSIWIIPQQSEETKRVTWTEMAEDIDWAGTLLASSLMALLFSALAVITNNVAYIGRSGLFIPLSLGWIILVAFLFWQDCWERDSTQGIQNSLWTNNHFISICLVIFFIYASSHSTSQLTVLVFQRAQSLSVLQSSWRYLPIPIIGALSSFLTPRLLYRVPANDILATAVLLSALSPFLMAIIDANSPYLKSAVFAVSLNPIASNAIIPLASMMVANTFPLETQGLAMGVLCTVAMIGASVGLALTALVSNDMATHLQHSPAGHSAPEIWISGYRSAFWFLFSLSLVALLVTLSCLRKLGYLGRGLEIQHL